MEVTRFPVIFKDMTDNKKIQFSALLTPNRSLSAKGFLVLMAVIGGVSFSVGIYFMWLGAWPVFGFFGLDVLLIYWAFKKNFSDSEIRELIEVTDRELVVHRFLPKKPARKYSLNRHWVRLELAEDKARELVGALTVHSHGKVIEIASFLGPDERKDFYLVLNRALGRAGVN